MLRKFPNIVLLAAAVAAPNPAPMFCPQPSALHYHGLRWYAGNSWQHKIWRSYSPSFVHHIKKFLGAQWIGVKVGQIICLYQGTEAQTFPVALQPFHPMIIKEPMTSQWIKGKHGYKQCWSNRVTDCGFFSQQSMVSGDIYQQIRYRGHISS